MRFAECCMKSGNSVMAANPSRIWRVSPLGVQLIRLVYKIVSMSQAAPAITRSPAEVVRQTPVSQAANGICYAVAGETAMNSFDLERMIAAVPGSAAAALERKAYYFVPLTVSQGDETLIADRYD